MEGGRTTAILWGAILILLGVAFLAMQLFGLPYWVSPERSWPLIIVGVAVLLAVIGLLTRTAGMAVPVAVVGGIGLLLYYQNLTNDWESWAYAWALIPGFVGLGIVVAGLLSGRPRGAFGSGLWLILISVVLFLVFGFFLGPLREFALARYWPVLVIAMGLFLLLRSLLRGDRTADMRAVDGEKTVE